MSTVWMTSDWHLGHKAILKYRQDDEQFKTREELELLLVNNFKSMVNKRDVTYFLGDMCFDRESLFLIEQLPGRKLLILGNHDDHLGVRDYLEVFDDVIGPIKYKGFWLTHQPIYEGELYSKPNIHGHTHNQSIYSSEGNLHPMYYNVSIDVHNFKPKKFIDIVEELSIRKY